jgi:Glycosyl hydrolase 2 galactose-binding domain-like
MVRTELRTGWTVHAVSGDSSGRVPEAYPAEVPGCVHTDLIAAGVIPDPYLDGNEAALSWMHEIDWRYATRLDVDALDLRPPSSGQRIDLVFDGIDTVGTIRLDVMRPEALEARPSTTSGRNKIELGRTYNFSIRRPMTGTASLIAGSAHISVCLTNSQIGIGPLSSIRRVL